MELVITIPDEVKERVLAALCEGYEKEVTTVVPGKVDDGKGGTRTEMVEKQVPNPVTQEEFAKGFLIRYIKKEVSRQEVAAAQRSVAAAKKESVEKEIQLS